jgi:Domain of unknown function (DUF4383)
MEAPNPAKLYASAVGALLTIIGIVGFFYSGSFGSPGEVDGALGLFDVNGWGNVLHLVTGLVGLVAAGYAARAYALGAGILYTVVAIWGFAIGGGESILSIIPVNGAENAFHLLLGVAGLAAAAATRVRGASARI